MTASENIAQAMIIDAGAPARAEPEWLQADWIRIGEHVKRLQVRIAKATLEAKALTLSGGPASVSPPTGRNLYAWVMETGKADIFLTYCTNALLAKADVPSLSIVAIPKPLNVARSYSS